MKNKKLNQISFLANESEVLQIEKLKFINLILKKDTKIKDIIMNAINEENIKLQAKNTFDENQTELFAKTLPYIH